LTAELDDLKEVIVGERVHVAAIAMPSRFRVEGLRDRAVTVTAGSMA
jgi:hypothetical protein